MEKVQAKSKSIKKVSKEKDGESEKIEQTYEIFHQPERTGIKDSRTGEIITEGFDEKSVGILMALEKIMNQLDKISIASGAQ